MDIYNEQSMVFVRRLASVTSQSEVNLYPYIASCALDIICGSFNSSILFVQSPGVVLI